MKNLTTGVLVAAMLLLSGAALAQPPSTAGLWSRADGLAETSRRSEESARTDIRRGLVDAALMRYRNVVQTIGDEIAVLETLCGHERDLDRQQVARMRLAESRDRLERAEDIMHLLRVNSNRR
ncbi:MAG: hypothetical protein R3F39_21740 [Myxococcota bacterium]